MNDYGITVSKSKQEEKKQVIFLFKIADIYNIYGVLGLKKNMELGQG